MANFDFLDFDATWGQVQVVLCCNGSNSFSLLKQSVSTLSFNLIGQTNLVEKNPRSSKSFLAPSAIKSGIGHGNYEDIC